MNNFVFVIKTVAIVSISIYKIGFPIYIQINIARNNRRLCIILL